MAKKSRAKAKPRARRKKKKAAFSPKLQFMKIVAGLTLLISLVITAGLLANRLLMRPAPSIAPAPKPVPIDQPKSGAVHHSVPDYEAFHRETVPPPLPIKRPKPVTNGIPVAIIIDDIGYVRKDEAETSVLFELVMHRYERRSLLVTSNQPFSEWENVFSTSAMTVAAVDRLVDHSTLIQINGESYRLKDVKKRTKRRRNEKP